jgi:sigma-B regulation protein RsbU (phosphoserine phosphatase)
MRDWTEDRLELALRASNEGVWDWDLPSNKIQYSGRILKFLGCRRQEMPHLFEDPDLVHEDEVDAFREEVARALKQKGDTLLAVEPRMWTKKGGWRWFRIRGAIVRDDEGVAKRLVGTMIDISRRKRMEEKLLEERHLMRLLIDNVPLNIYFKNKRSEFTLVNQSMAEWLGMLDPDEVAGKSDRDFFGEEHWKKAWEDEKRIMETGEAMPVSVERETWTGRDDTWVLTSKMPRLDRKGRLQGTFGVSSNVTELVSTQQALAEVAAKLQARNEEMEEELLLASEVQQALLPREYPTLPAGVAVEESRVLFGHRYIPISGLAGDFFEVFPIGDDRMGMLICDVMGHGVRSAVVVSMLRGLGERAAEVADDPAAFLSELNKGLSAILNKADVTMFATAFFAVVDLAKDEIRYASAGHPAGIICGEEGASVLPLGESGPGPALGLFPDAKFQTQCVKARGVHYLLMFTDGIFEVENSEGEAFLQNRLVQVVTEAKGEGMEPVLDLVLERVLSFAESRRFDDDVCLLGMELRPE